jgi:uncharacterized protein (DUF4415 family)
MAARVQKKASVHEKTVQKVAKGEVEKSKRKRAAVTPRKRVRRQVKITVNADVLVAAKALAEGDAGRILIISEDTVIVMNYPKQFTRKHFA